MQRLCRQRGDETNSLAKAEDHARLVTLLKHKLPTATLQIFAEPRSEGEHVNWFSKAGGQPQLLSALPADEAAAGRGLLEERLGGIHSHLEQLTEQEASDHELVWLKALAQVPADDAVYVLNGQPVIVSWPGLSSIPAPSAPVARVPASTAIQSVAGGFPPTGGSGGPSEPPQPPEPADRSSRRWPWLLGLLLLALGAGWWLWHSGKAEQLLAKWFGPDAVELLEQKLVQSQADCLALEQILSEDPLFVTPPENEKLAQRVSALQVEWQQRMRLCFLGQLALLQQQIEAAESCEQLAQILATEPLLLRQESEFVAARSALSIRVQLCGVQRLNQRLVEVGNDCAALLELLSQEPALQNPDAFFTLPAVTSAAPYKQMLSLLAQREAFCLEQQNQQLADELEQKLGQIEDCDELKLAIESSALLKREDPVFVAVYERAQQRLQTCIEERAQAEQIDNINRQLKANTGKCSKLRAMLKDSTLWTPETPEINQLRQLVQQLVDACNTKPKPTKPKPKPEVTADPEPKPKPATKSEPQALAPCPGERPPEQAPEFVLAFDGSGSMGISMNLSNRQLKKLKNFPLNIPDIIFGTFPSNIYSEPTRITVAKQAAERVVSKLPSDTSAGLVVFDDCPVARNEGFYPPSQRRRLLNRINVLSPRQGTPLASAVRMAGRMVDGVSRDGVIVLISDGEESCGMDPCAEALRLKSAKPRVKVNVVDIMGTGAANCVAKITGGKVYTARNAAQIAQMTEKAAEDALLPAHCRP